jgi:hypothetical protein
MLNRWYINKLWKLQILHAVDVGTRINLYLFMRLYGNICLFAYVLHDLTGFLKIEIYIEV